MVKQISNLNSEVHKLDNNKHSYKYFLKLLYVDNDPSTISVLQKPDECCHILYVELRLR